MRGLAAIVLGVALLLAVPAAARVQAETVTLKIGETKLLQTVFDKKKPQTLVVSGVITRDLGGGLTQKYDPFWGFTGNCKNAGPSVYLQIQDAHGAGIDYSGAGQPPCRPDHRYEFTINDAPPAWDLNGKAKAFITLRASAGITSTGFFTLRVIDPGKERQLGFTVRAKKELRESKTDDFLADILLNGSGSITDPESDDPDVKGQFSLTLVWIDRDDGQLQLRPLRAGVLLGVPTRIGLLTEVVKSNEPTCPKGSRLHVGLQAGAVDKVVVVARDTECKAVLRRAEWTEPASEIALNIRKG